MRAVLEGGVLKDSKRETVVVQNVNVPGYANLVDGKKYLATKEALLKVLPDRGPGLTQAEMTNGVLPICLSPSFPGARRRAGGLSASSSTSKQKESW